MTVNDYYNDNNNDTNDNNKSGDLSTDPKSYTLAVVHESLYFIR